MRNWKNTWGKWGMRIKKKKIITIKSRYGKVRKKMPPGTRVFKDRKKEADKKFCRK